jgi:peptidoglycan/xylan/chitin deacetylase (PgdA/CDA1 family)
MRRNVLIGIACLAAAAGCAPGLLPAVAQRAAPRVLFSVPTSERVVALTIDDGPSEATDGILDVLGEHGARASFFVIGGHVKSDSAAARRIVSAGHELAHHMLADQPSIRLPQGMFEQRFDEMDRLLEGLGGAAHFFRPGSGWFSEPMVRAVEKRGYRLVLGSVYPFDAQIPVPRFLAWYLLRSVHPGGIIVLHDGPERGPRTADVLRRVLPELRRRGYDVVTLSELIRRSQLAPQRSR